MLESRCYGESEGMPIDNFLKVTNLNQPNYTKNTLPIKMNFGQKMK